MNSEAKRIRAVDGALSCLCAGPAAGHAVVLIHGLGWDAERLWRSQIRALASAGWQVFAPDMRGVGQSVRLDQPASIPDYADDIEAMLDEHGVRHPMFVGFSMGCMIAADLVLRPAVQAAGLVLACGGLRSTSEGAKATEDMLARAIDLGPVAFSAEQARSVFGPTYAAAQPDAVEEFIRWRAEMDQTSLHHAFRAPYGCDYESRAKDIPCPIAFIAADTDMFLPLPAVQDLAAKIPGADVKVIAQSGHMAPVEHPEAFNRILLDVISRFRP